MPVWFRLRRLRMDGTGDVVARVRDPMRALAGDAFVPVVFRVDADAFRRAASAGTTDDE